MAVYNAVGVCDITPYRCWDPMRSLSVISDFYSAATGISVSPQELKKKGERIWNLERLLNAREGFSREDDTFSGVEIQNVEQPMKLQSGERYLQDWFGRRLSEDDLRRTDQSRVQASGRGNRSHARATVGAEYTDSGIRLVLS